MATSLAVTGLRRGIRLRHWAQVAAGRVALALILAAIVQVLSVRQVGGPGIIPGPLAILGAAADALGQAATYSALGQTMGAWLVAMTLATVIGVAVGVALGASGLLFRSTSSVIDFLRSIPPVALVPVGVLTLGVTERFKVAIALQVCLWPVILQTMSGVHAVDRVARDVGRSIRMSRTQTLRWVVLPSALPYIGTGLRISAVLALLACVASELLAGVPGLGQIIYVDQASGLQADMWGMALLIALLGLLVTKAFVFIEHKLSPWQRASLR